MNPHLMNDFNMIIVIRMLVNGGSRNGNNLYGKLHFLCRVGHMTEAKNTCKTGFNSTELLSYLLSKLYAMRKSQIPNPKIQI
jgi:hypothetical protein